MRQPNARRESGMSLIEVLIAAAILLTIALGLIPLFSAAINDNSAGNQASQATNHARSQAESLFQLPLDNQAIELAAGQPDLATTDSWASGAIREVGDANEGWWSGQPTDKGLLLWTRRTTVRQFNVDDIAGDPEFDHPLPGGTATPFYQLKEITIQITPNGSPGNPLRRGPVYTIRTYKAF